MSGEYGYNARLMTRGSWTTSLIALLIAFMLGLALAIWILARWDRGAELLGINPAGPPPAVEAAASTSGRPQRSASVAPNIPESPPADQGISRRIVALEEKLARIDTQSRAAVGNADRAEGMLVAFAARRALDRGVPLGYIEGLLQERFGNSQRQAVATIITASRKPITLQELQEGLQEVRPRLAGVGPDQNWWSALRAELSSLVTIRKRGTPPTMPEERLRRAIRRLEAGQVDVALAEVLRMPGRENAAQWIDAARQYAAARRALDTIETAALLGPRTGRIQ